MQKKIFITLSFLLAGLVASPAATPAPTHTIEVKDHDEKGDLYIYKAVNHTPDLCNPVLFVEGFDLYNDMNWEALYPLLNHQNLITDLQQAGRDVIILNFHDATIDIKKNAKVNKKAIEYINHHRNDMSDTFSVVGVSMGGLISRLALIELKDKHNVDTWISFDSPHEGANIPLGLQEYVEFYEDYSDISTNFIPLVELLDALDSKAAKQMLIVHHSKNDDEAKPHADFKSLQNDLTKKGYPKHCKTIAISNGSGFGEKLPFNAGDPIIHWDNTLLPYINTDIYALPHSGITPPAANQDAPILFLGEFYTLGGSSETVLSQYKHSLDNAPGGMMDTFAQVYNQLLYTTTGADFLAQSNHCFIPTVSALGIPLRNIAANVSAETSLQALSPFDEIYYAASNEMHMEITPRNKYWFMRAILGDLDSDSDGFNDYQEYLLGTAYDSPDNRLFIKTAINYKPILKKVALSYSTFAHTESKVWFTESLAEPWRPIDTVPPATQLCISNEYDMAATSGFYKVTAELIDPAAAPIVQGQGQGANSTNSANAGQGAGNTN